MGMDMGNSISFLLECEKLTKLRSAGAATIALSGAAVGNALRSLIHSVARNPYLAKQVLEYAILL